MMMKPYGCLTIVAAILGGGTMIVVTVLLL
jgi:hypothetical protein